MSWLATITGIFFIGHSLFGPTNPQMMAQVLADRGVTVEAQIINGAPLSWQWEHGADAEGTNARTTLPTGRFDTVILTEAVPLHNHIAHSGTAENAKRYYDLAVRANPRARVFLQEVWHDMRSGSGVDIPYDDRDDIPWLERIKQDLDTWHGVLDSVNAQRPHGAEPMRLIPAAQALALLAGEIRAGSVPGIRGIDALFSDDIHPNDLGFYFLTMVQYATVTGESPEGLPRRLQDRWGGRYAAPNPAQAQALQRIAWAAVDAYRETAPPAPAPAAEQAAAQTAATSTDSFESIATRAQPGFDPPPIPEGPVPLAIGLAGVNDWSAQQPFVDVFKTAREWVGHLPGEWGGVSHAELDQAGYLDENGWPQAIPPELGSIGTVILTDLPEDASSAAGRYVLSFDGKGIVEVTGRARNVRYGNQQVSFDFAPGDGSVDIRIQRTDLGGDYVRNIRVIKEENLAIYEAGAVFNPIWIDHVMGFDVYRFMNWMQTNGSTQSEWRDRPKPGDYTWGRNGVPVEVMVELLNRTGADGWFNMPHLATDEYMQRFAEIVRDTLWVEQKAYVEYSNEVWNWQFPQAQWAEEQAKARWEKEYTWVQYYAKRAVEMSRIWTEVFGAAADERLVRVVATQTGWIGLEDAILLAPEWVAEENGRAIPATHFDAYAVTGYFGGTLGWEDRAPMVRRWLDDSLAAARAAAEERGLTGAARDTFVQAHRYDLASAQAWAEIRDGAVSGDPADTLLASFETLFPHHAEVAERHGLDLIMYEGGTHVTASAVLVDDVELMEFFHHLNYSAEMGELYREMIAGWHAAGGKLFNAFLDVYRPNKWGSWGHLRHLSDDNPRWDALIGYR
ncbi:hypothetical protein ACFORG_11150 [Lutimaribacter marinistellae]|uniref:Uncharacterized protein n=1 Tax=Lutimaribacter marinistellae TaxID=1820329 RepID=A0ABV7THV4_9RHOB